MAKALQKLQPVKAVSALIALILIFAAGGPDAAQVQPPISPSATAEAPYRLGAGDEFSVTASHSDELNNKTFRVSITGDVNFPGKGVGTIHVAGMTLQELQAEITTRLSETIKRPEVSININQYRSQPV